MMRATAKVLKSILLGAWGRGKTTLLTVMVALTLACVTPALAANGGNFILGKINTATAFSRLSANVAGPAMQIFNTNTAANARALDLIVDAGNPPMTVNATAGKAPNLDADKLDGKDSSAFQGKYAQTVVVAKSGGDFTSVQAALNSITDASNSKRYLVWVGPGTYNERVQMKSFVDIEGAGELATKITAAGGGTNLSAGSSVVSGASDAELRYLTAENTGGNTNAIAIFNASASPRLSNVTATASGGSDINQGVANSGSSPTMTHVTATASGGNAAFGVANSGSSSPTMTDVTAKGSGAPYNVGVNNAGSSPTMTDVTATASGGANARGIENSTSSPNMTNVTATASGGSTENTGVDNYLHSSPTIRESVISASGTTSLGVWGNFPDDTTSVVTIENSEVKGATGTVKAEGGYKVNVGASKLDGGAVSAVGTGSAVKCAGVHDENYVFSPSTCP
jgi:hypothetical protein